MKYIQIEHTDLKASNIIMGNMRLTELSLQEAETLIKTALDEGINFFDHADIYGKSFGKSEELFAKAIQMDAHQREKMILQSKCGIRLEEGYYDLSKEHILTSVDGILQRLQTDYLDILLLHRPDPLMDPREIGEAFDLLHRSGKVKYFGVSNFNPAQIDLLQKHISQKLIVNQLQLSIAHTPMIDSGVAFNMKVDQAIDRDNSILEYARLHDMTIQAWSPFQHGFFEGTFLGDQERFPELNEVLDDLAQKYDVTNTAIATSWITHHPANIQVILGTTNPQRLKDACQGAKSSLTKEEWYRIYKAAGNIIP